MGLLGAWGLPDELIAPFTHPAVSGTVSEVKDYGVLCDVDAHPDIVGIAAPNQVGAGVWAALKAGAMCLRGTPVSPGTACVLCRSALILRLLPHLMGFRGPGPGGWFAWNPRELGYLIPL